MKNHSKKVTSGVSSLPSRAWQLKPYMMVFIPTLGLERASLVAQMVRNPPVIQCKRPRKIPWRREWQPTPLLPGESHGQRNLAGYSPWVCKESDMTEWFHLGLENSEKQMNYGLQSSSSSLLEKKSTIDLHCPIQQPSNHTWRFKFNWSENLQFSPLVTLALCHVLMGLAWLKAMRLDSKKGSFIFGQRCSRPYRFSKTFYPAPNLIG